MAKEGKKRELEKTLDLSELYSDMVPVDKLIQTDAELNYYTAHTAYWNDRVNQEAARMQKEIAESSDEIDAREDPSRPEHYKTVDAAQEYDGMLLETDAELRYYKAHTQFWNDRVNQEAARMQKEIAENSDEIDAREDPSRPEHYKTVDAAEEYNGMLV